MMIDVPLAPSPGWVLTTKRNQTGKKAVGDEYFRTIDEVIVTITDQRVLMPCKSDPAAGSVIPMAPINSPLAMRGKKRCF